MKEYICTLKLYDFSHLYKKTVDAQIYSMLNATLALWDWNCCRVWQDDEFENSNGKDKAASPLWL